MNVYSLLKQDHAKVESIFEALEDTITRTPKMREALFTELYSELRLHAEAEETVFYPRIFKSRETHEMTLEAIEEHNVIKTLLTELDSDPKDTEHWGAKLKVLREVVNHHVKEEELELFERAKRVLSKEEAEAIAEEIEAFKKKSSAVLK